MVWLAAIGAWLLANLARLVAGLVMLVIGIVAIAWIWQNLVPIGFLGKSGPAAPVLVDARAGTPQGGQQAGQQQGGQTSRGITSSAVWPASAGDAASLFGGDASRWERTAEGRGWHFREEAFRTVITPVNGVLEGYYDTNPGRDPRQFVAIAAIEVQGATVWPRADVSPEQLMCKMGNQKFGIHGVPSNFWLPGIDAVGFTKPGGCSGENPTGVSTAQQGSSAQPPAQGGAPPPASASGWVSDPAGTFGASGQRSAQADQWEGCPGESTCWHLKDGSMTQVTVTEGSSYEGWDGSKVVSGKGSATLSAAGLTVRRSQ